ncbi:MAG: hypothetical protein DMG80_12015 [Acidobacteria bacterium]|nr:MAG: hypothetical protein DMG80_12015 [Acidobacteriota bacterium]
MKSKQELIEASAAQSSFDAKAGILTVTVIKPGLTRSQARYYPADVLKRDYRVFEGAKMFLNHQSSAEEKARPEGSLLDWVASLKNVSVESDGTVKGKAIIIDPQFKKKVIELDQKGLLQELGVSIRAMGEAEPKTINGVKTNSVESLTGCRSVDFVTYPNAGGRAELLESEREGIDIKKRLVRSYMLMGLTEAEAFIAAGIELEVKTCDDPFGTMLSALSSKSSRRF